jgi:hypothetical protein
MHPNPCSLGGAAGRRWEVKGTLGNTAQHLHLPTPPPALPTADLCVMADVPNHDTFFGLYEHMAWGTAATGLHRPHLQAIWGPNSVPYSLLTPRSLTWSCTIQTTAATASAAPSFK